MKIDCKTSTFASMTLTELEDYFHGIDIPQTIQMDAATHIFDVPDYVNTTIMRAKLWKGTVDRNPSIWHLQKLHDMLEAE